MGLLQSSQSVVLLVILLLLVAVNIAIFVSTQQRGGARREWDSRVVEERGYGRWSPADTRVRRPRQYSVGLQNAIVPSGKWNTIYLHRRNRANYKDTHSLSPRKEKRMFSMHS